MRATLPLLALLGACSDAGVTKFNATPTAEITSHVDGDTVREGYPEALRGVVGDPNHDVDELTVHWFIDGAEACVDELPEADGTVNCEADFVPGGGEVVLEVRDPDGDAATARVTLSVQATDAPTADITAPTSDGVYYSDQLTVFEGTISDGEDDPGSLGVVWESGLDGVLTGGFDEPDSEGALLGSTTLSEGEHFLTLTVTDTTGKEGRDSVTFMVGPANSTPTCAITAPVTGDAGPSGATVTFLGEVGDVDVPSDWLTVDWESDKDGVIGASSPDSSGNVTFPYSTLSVDTHVVTMTVTDEVGATCATNVIYTVGTAPTLVVTSPATGDVFNETAAVPFSATVSDAEDLVTAITLSWVSDVDGEFSTQGADSTGAIDFDDGTLTPGAHTLTVTATDTDGLYDQAIIDFTINQVPTAPTVGITPDPAYTANDLTASASGSTDPDGSGTVTYAYVWYEDSVLSSASTSDVFPTASTTKHSTYEVVVTPNDGTGDGPTTSASVTVLNTAPVLGGPTLSAATVHRGDVLTCTSTATDDDGDLSTLTYAWSDGSTGSTYTVTSADAAGDIITCTATADDGDGGTDTGTASATVVNTPPSVTGVTLTPTTVQTNDTLTVTATTSDADGDPITVTYDWYVASTLVLSGSGNTLSGATYFDKHETVYVDVVADDTVDTTTVSSSSVTVDNTPPGAPGISITPSAPEMGDDLICTVDTPSSDDDSDSVTYEMQWTVNGVPYAAGGTTDTGGLDSGDPGWVGPSTTTWPDDTVDGADVDYSQDWVCTVIPNDGDDDGALATTTVTSASDAIDFVMFTTSNFLGSSSSSWITNRAAGDAYCASYAASSGVAGSDFRIVYSTASEDAKDYLLYDNTAGDRVFDRYGTQIDGGDLWGAGRVTLSDIKSWTITGTNSAGEYKTCSGGYPAGSWPICQYCSQKFACASSSDDPFAPGSCCWTGTRAIVCMGTL
jgi:hypothetical protein